MLYGNEQKNFEKSLSSLSYASLKVPDSMEKPSESLLSMFPAGLSFPWMLSVSGTFHWHMYPLNRIFNLQSFT